MKKQQQQLRSGKTGNVQLESRARRDAPGAMTGCCAKCGQPVTVESGPVNDIVCTHIQANCLCGPASINIWPAWRDDA